MYHLLILYNPYYQSDVIESHLEILKQKHKVAFGKVKSHLRTASSSSKTEITESSGRDFTPHALADSKASDSSTIASTKDSNAPSSIESNGIDSKESTLAQDTNATPNTHPAYLESRVASLTLEQPTSKQPTLEQPTLETLARQVSADSPLQLFLTDYASLFVAKVTQILPSEELDERQKCELDAITPHYYQNLKAGLSVELWFIIEDMRELVRNDFVRVRESLASFTTPHNGNHTYALYGNTYTYPLIVQSKREAWYFRAFEEGGALESRQDSKKDSKGLDSSTYPKAQDFKAGALPHYHSIFKSEEQITLRERLIDYMLGERVAGLLDVDCMDNLVSAELEYQANKGNPLYDSTGIVMWYARTFELELSSFVRELLSCLALESSEILELIYSVQGKKASVSQWLESRAEIEPNLGAYKFLLQNVRHSAKLWQNEKPKTPAQSPAQHAQNQAQNLVQNHARSHKDFESLSPLALKLEGLGQSLDSKNRADSQAGQNLAKTPTHNATQNHTATQNLSQNLTRNSSASSHPAQNTSLNAGQNLVHLEQKQDLNKQPNASQDVGQTKPATQNLAAHKSHTSSPAQNINMEQNHRGAQKPSSAQNNSVKQSPAQNHSTQKYAALDSLSTLPTRFEIVSLACHKIPKFIELMQSIRNPAAHESKPTIAQARILRAQILGIEGESLLCALSLARLALQCEV